jgi:hypothetical protein
MPTHFQRPASEPFALGRHEVSLGLAHRVQVRYADSGFHGSIRRNLKAHCQRFLTGEGNSIMAEETASQGTAPAAPPVAAAATPAAVEAAPQETKIKVRKPRQRSCDEKDAKGKLCAGHLKRWYDYPKDVAGKIGKDAEIYRCEFCKTLYKPDPQQLPHSFTLNY